MLAIINNLYVTTFKQGSTSWLQQGIVVGCLKISHQSIFTGANNFTIHGLDAKQYAGFFGFTYSETEKLLQTFELLHFKDLLTQWYDGYRMGDEHLFCPWSVSNFCANAIEATNFDFEPRPYWINTSNNNIIKLYLQYAVDNNRLDQLNVMQEFLQGTPQEIILQEFDTYPNLSNYVIDFNSFMTLLLHTGYLTFTNDSPLYGHVILRIPNLEIQKCFEAKVSELYTIKNPTWVKKSKTLLHTLLINDYNTVYNIINNMLGVFISLRKTYDEFFYQNFIQGILALVAGAENITLESEVDADHGYADIVLTQRSTLTVVILEFKKSKNDDIARIKAADEAADQIIQRNYAQKYMNMYYEKIFGLGLGFGGKHCAIKALGNLA